MGYYEELKEKIIEEVKKKGYIDKLIDYQEFQGLYKLYKSEISEIEFGKILGIKEHGYYNFKAGKRKAKILKGNIVSEQRRQEVKEQIKAKGYIGKFIDYIGFKELYKLYELEMSEQEFAGIIGITYSSYKSIKNQGKRAKLFKQETCTEERKEEIVKELQKKGYEEKLIDYTEFKQFYDLYKTEMSEQEFAETLQIKYANYMHIKNEGGATKILSVKEVSCSKERKKEILEEIKKKGYIKKAIGYEEFKKIYNVYQSEMSEQEFAEILGIKYSNYRSMKNNGIVVNILKNVGYTEDIKNQIKEQIKQKGYIGKTISYKEFKQLYNEYETQISEIEFSEILGMTYISYMHMQKGQNSKVLKKEECSQARKEEIQKELQEKGYKDKLITYEEFQELYEQYRTEMGIAEFCKILGITDGNYRHIRDRGTKARVDFNNTTHNVLHLLSESRYYTKEEIEEICKKSDITIEEFLTILNKKIQIKQEELLKNGKVYIGRRKIDTEFLDKYGSELLKFCESTSKNLGFRYNLSRLREDIASEAILNLIETRGDIVLNFQENEAIEVLKKICYKSIKYLYITSLKVKIEYPLEDKKQSKDGKTYTSLRWLRDKEKNTEEKAIELYENSEIIIPNSYKDDDLYRICIKVLNKCHENGMNGEESIKFICEKIGVEKKELLDIMEKYLIEQNKVKKTKEGKYIRGGGLNQEAR